MRVPMLVPILLAMSFGIPGLGRPNTKEVPLSAATVSSSPSYATDEEPVFHISGVLPNTSYRLALPSFRIVQAETGRSGQVIVAVRAINIEGPALDVRIPYEANVRMPIKLNPGNYDLIMSDGKHVGTFQVSKGRFSPFYFIPSSLLSPAVTSDLDEHVLESLLAVMQRVEIQSVKGDARVKLIGNHPNTCIRMVDVKVIRQQAKVFVLPRVEFTEGPDCRNEPLPFETVVSLPKLDSGNYLLNVLSQNGTMLRSRFRIE